MERKEAYHIYEMIKDALIGNKGVPDKEGNAISGFVRAAELQYNAPKGAYWFREARPDDTFFGGTAHTYHNTFTTATAEGCFGAASTAEHTVPTRESIVSFGWFCELDLDAGGYLQAQKHKVPKQELPGRIVWRMTKPDHIYVDMDTVLHGVENEKFRFLVYNGYGSDRVGVVVPLIYRIAPRAALNLEKPIV